jgi:Flp pilus assembly protein CpaB
VDFAENILSSRRGTLLLGAGAAVLAAILLIVYLNRYRSSLKGSSAATPVLVAKRFIQKGAPGSLIGAEHQYQVASVPTKDLRDGALVDPTSLRGLVATQDIYQGQQLTAADFAPTAPDALQNKLSGRARAISIPIDAPHGMIGQINAGDHVDVYVGLNLEGPGGAIPTLKLLIPDALVLRTPTSGATPGTIVLRALGAQAPALAYASDNGKLWLFLRPASGAKPVRPGLITAERLLGTRPVR